MAQWPRAKGKERKERGKGMEQEGGTENVHLRERGYEREGEKEKGKEGREG